MQTDISGVENVIKYIEATKLTKFTILRATLTNQFIPIFECSDTVTNSAAIEAFANWASISNSGIAYKICMYNLTKEAGELGEAPKKAGGKIGKMECTFNLSTLNAGNASQQQNFNTNGLDLAAFKAELLKEIHQKEESELVKEVKALSLKFAEMEEEEEEEEEGLAGIKPDTLAQIMGVINMLKGGGAPAAINGTDDNAEQLVLINQAVKILYRHDKTIGTNLMKLADIAETKPETFKMLLTTLQTM